MNIIFQNMVGTIFIEPFVENSAEKKAFEMLFQSLPLHLINKKKQVFLNESKATLKQKLLRI